MYALIICRRRASHGFAIRIRGQASFILLPSDVMFSSAGSLDSGEENEQIEDESSTEGVFSHVVDSTWEKGRSRFAMLGLYMRRYVFQAAFS